MHVGGRIIVNGVDVTNQVNTGAKGQDISELLIELIVPERVKLAMEGVLLSEVSGIIGETKINAGGVEKHVLESVAQIKAKISGQGKIEIGKVEGGKNKTNISGHGHIRVNSGKMEDLNASVSGAGNIDINAEVVDADLEVSGAANIRVLKVTGDLSKSVSGAGNINVGSRK